MKQTIIFVDANSLIHRAFHALPPFRTPEGELVNAVYGFYSILLNIITRLHPDYAVVSFDVSKKTFRHEVFEEYKAHRVKAPDELYEQFDRIREILALLNIPICEKEGYEADDVLATLATSVAQERDIEAFIVTSDKDSFQLINEKTFVASPKRGGSDIMIYNDEEVMKKLGITPAQVIDYKALTGDPSDNIPGVPGIGKKTAQKLLSQYKTLDGIYDHLDDITGSLHNKLKDNKKEAYFSQKLVTLVHDVPINFTLEASRFRAQDFEKVLPLFDKLAFRSLIQRVNTMIPKKEPEPEQTSLF